jgi:hypothetical protein
MWFMPVRWWPAGLRIIQAASVAALLLFLSSDFGLNSVMGKAEGPASVFKPALEQIRLRTQIPIVLPSKLPSAIPEKDIKLAWGEVRGDGYFISLYFSEPAVDATFAAGFGGSTVVLQNLPNTRRIALSGGRIGMFRPVSCGGSCAPANLWWEQNGVGYQIQIKLANTIAETEQRRVLLEVANSSVTITPTRKP